MESNTVKTTQVQQELQSLREEIKQFAESLQAFENGDASIPPAEVIATLNGIGEGALSCAALLKYVAAQAKPTQASIELKRVQIREDAGEIVRRCTELCRLLRRLKRNVMSVPATEMEELEGISQQVQGAICGISSEWEDLG